MMDRSSAFEQLGCKVKEEERITTKIPDYQDIAIPPEYPSGYPARSPSPNNSWSREMVETEAKFAQDVAAIICSNHLLRKEELAWQTRQ